MLALRWVGPRTAGLAHAIVIGALFALLMAYTDRSCWQRHRNDRVHHLGLGGGIAFAVLFTTYALVQTAVNYASLAVAVFSFWFLA